ncbi:hypothetical protein [Caulobacter sp.]|jgi:hypothetical protein|uniref:hypothetical protein n=1 Tax=Caulobacter sp. TaxID=78 RepID=UPI00160DF208
MPIAVLLVDDLGPHRAPKGYYPLTVERLRNIITARQSSLEHQRQLGELEDPDVA